MKSAAVMVTTFSRRGLRRDGGRPGRHGGGRSIGVGIVAAATGRGRACRRRPARRAIRRNVSRNMTTFLSDPGGALCSSRRGYVVGPTGKREEPTPCGRPLGLASESLELVQPQVAAGPAGSSPKFDAGVPGRTDRSGEMGDVTNVIVADPAPWTRSAPPGGDHRDRLEAAVPPLPPAGHARVVLPGPASRTLARSARCSRSSRYPPPSRMPGCCCAGTSRSRGWSKRIAPSARHLLPHDVALRLDDGGARAGRCSPRSRGVAAARSSIAFAVATLGRPLIEFVVKALVGRDRPDLDRMVTATARRSRAGTSWRRWRSGG